MKNGIVTSGSGMGRCTTSPGSSWHSPPHCSMYLSPPASQAPVVATISQHQQNAPIGHQPVRSNCESQGVDSRTQFPAGGDGQQSSPEWSENFSPPTSPVLENFESRRSDCPLMDEVDRGEFVQT